MLPGIQQPTRPIASNRNLASHSTDVPETARHVAVVRSPHSRPAPFRWRFQNARSVRGHQHISARILTRSTERDRWRLSGMGKPVFWLDTIPLHQYRPPAAQWSRRVRAPAPQRRAEGPRRFPHSSRAVAGRHAGGIRAWPEKVFAIVAVHSHNVHTISVSAVCPRPHPVHDYIRDLSMSTFRP